FLPKILSLGILDGITGNVVGSWNTLGLFAGFASLMFLLMIEFFAISKIEKIVLSVFVLLSVLLTATVNFPLVWLLLGIFSTIVFVYKISITLEKSEGEDGVIKAKYFPVVSFVVMLVSLLFFISSGFLGNIIPNSLQISNTEVNPSLSSTMSIAKEVLVKNPIFGIGPNKFKEAWSMYKPLSINNTQFWNVSFNSGSGLFPTFAATTGGVGILSWVVFFVLFLFIGVKSVFASIKKRINWEMVSFFILSLYLFISSLFYFTGPVMFLLSFAFSGIFIGLVASNSNKEFCISFLNDHRKSFFSISALIIVTVFFVTVAFKYTERFISIYYFEKALSAQAVPDAKDFIGKALSLYSNDFYLRTYSQIYLIDLNSLLSKGKTLSDAENATLQAIFDQALQGAQMAINFDSKNYLNYQLLGSVYQTAGVLGVKDAYGKAMEAFKSASAINVNSPELKLSLANISIADKKNKEAKDYANQSLSLKPDYIDALILLSQIATSENDNISALSYGEKALSVSPTSPDLIKYVDSLKNPNKVVNQIKTPVLNTKKP
ncbi:MAG: hypothetical protein WCG28_00755, partial [bacterium]